jgi:hypothetical protein
MTKQLPAPMISVLEMSKKSAVLRAEVNKQELADPVVHQF